MTLAAVLLGFWPGSELALPSCGYAVDNTGCDMLELYELRIDAGPIVRQRPASSMLSCIELNNQHPALGAWS